MRKYKYLNNQYIKRNTETYAIKKAMICIQRNIETYAIKKAMICILNLIKDQSVFKNTKEYEDWLEKRNKYINSTIKLLEETNE